MKSFRQYILEAEGEEKNDQQQDEKTTERGEIKFTIWEEPDKKVNWLNDNQKYQKIEYKYENKENHISIDFLLGFQDEEWKLWIGKIGSNSYDNDPWCSFETDDFAKAIVAALDKVEEFLDDVKENPDNWIQFYKDA